MKVGIAGYGVVGKTRHSSILKNTDYQVVAISEKNKEQHQNIPASIEIFEDYQSLINNADIDTIFISLPNQFAADASVLALKKGLNVFCEKPPSRTLNELQEVKNISLQHPAQSLMYGFNHRFHSSVEKAKTIITNNTLGRMVNLRGVYGKSQMISFS